MKSIEILNKHKTCRTCLKLHSSSNELISIFETEKFVFPHDSNNVQFSEMLSNVSNHLVIISLHCILPFLTQFIFQYSVQLMTIYQKVSALHVWTLCVQHIASNFKVKHLTIHSLSNLDRDVQTLKLNIVVIFLTTKLNLKKQNK